MPNSDPPRPSASRRQSQRILEMSKRLQAARSSLPPLASPKPDSTTKKEERQLAQWEKDQESRRVQREKVGPQIVWLTAVWLAVVLIIIIMSGFGNVFSFFQLSDAVLLGLLGSTTANVIGLFVILAKNLFPTAS